MTLRLVPDLNDTAPTDGPDPVLADLSERLHDTPTGPVATVEHDPTASIEALTASLFDLDRTHRAIEVVDDATEHLTDLLVGYHDDLVASVTMNLSGGWTIPQMPSLSAWEVQFTYERHDADGLRIVESLPVATMTLIVTNPVAGVPRDDLRRFGEDAGELGDILFHDSGERTDAFSVVVEDDYRPVLLIDTFEVYDGWRGTSLTPVLALRALKAFAHLGIDAAALCAAPIAEDMSVAERERVADRISTMWTKVGFTALDVPVTDGLDPLVMAATLDGYDLDETLHLLVGTDETLIVAAGL